MATIKFEGIGFNKEWIQSVSQEQFLAEVEINQHWWPNDPKRKEKAETLYRLLVPIDNKKGGRKKPPLSNTSDAHIHGTGTEVEPV